MKVIYIAGKYRGPTPWTVEQNIRAAQDVAAKVIAAGHMPLTPHLNTAHMEGLADDAFFLAGTMEILRRCDAILCVSNWLGSVGARAEVEEARRLGLPVFGVGHEFADYLGRVGPIDAVNRGFAMTIDAAIENLCEWADGDAGSDVAWLRCRLTANTLRAADRDTEWVDIFRVGGDGEAILVPRADVRTAKS